MMVTRHRTAPMAGAVLAGGSARRYGGLPKGLLRLGDGRTIIEREAAELRAAGVEGVVIVANEAAPYERSGETVIQDLRPGMGPLGGIEAALAWCRDRCDAILFLPCDLPGITAKEIAALAGGFAAASELVAVAVTEDSFWQPLCAVVHNDALPALSRALNEGRRTVREVWQELGAAEVRFDDPAPFFNVNSPADLARWRATLRGKVQDRGPRQKGWGAFEEQRRHPPGGLAVRSKIWFVRDDEHVFGPGLARLLRGVDRHGTLRQATRVENISYRHAWEEIRAAEKRLGRRLILRQAGGAGGGRSELSPEGRRLMELFDRINAEVADYADAAFARCVDGEEHEGHRQNDTA